jgi:hypothetical protein
MINPFKEVNWQPSTLELKKFSRSMLIGFTVLALVFGASALWREKPLTVSYVLLAVGVGLFLLQLIPPLNLVSYKVIFTLSCLMGVLVANLILIVFYYAVFCTISLIVRLCTGRDPLQLKQPETSNWKKYGRKKELSRYLKQY